jgi:putative endonuclease
MANPSSPVRLGDKGEDVAARYLTAHGFRIMDRNYRFERNEVDLVCYEPDEDDQGGELVFVEVKTRSGLGYGTPDESVTEAKQQSIRSVAQAYLYERQLEGAPARFDVVSVVLNQDDPPDVAHHRNAFF